MRILLLAEPGNIHTIRWANSLYARGVEIIVYGLGPFSIEDYSSEIPVFSEGLNHRGIFNKMRYLASIPKVWKIIREYKPDIVHAHYASSYGLLGKLSGFNPLVISVWGSDVYDFPRKSIFHSFILKMNLQSADWVLSTSHTMAKETKAFLSKNQSIEITPFGIDLSLFSPKKISRVPNEIVIGTIKSLYYRYGIDVLIKSFYRLKSKYPDVNFKLIIAGEGDDKPDFLSLVADLHLQDSVTFLGRVPHNNVPEILNQMDIFVALSNEESFGVAAIEASACQLPVVVSDAPGFCEVVENESTGLIVPRNNADQAALAMERLSFDIQLRANMGKAGRQRVQTLYEWWGNVDHMTAIYSRIINGLRH